MINVKKGTINGPVLYNFISEYEIETLEKNWNDLFDTKKSNISL